uniref:Uncharacterized protein n=1 Tax=Myoviridae sp. ctjhW4 TaxID=2825162 RepID=A0A8S5PRN1_9CAUD|nr:MAG TPA: hypothetical protein [Myoviridae sp. ctjhW4]
MCSLSSLIGVINLTLSCICSISLFIKIFL